ncbi:endonuclease VII domain-containing protein [Actinoplanes sp. TRM 88003]|uniref:Endonuclease VII domain-containing protein n=1 Tax=Paractinoplanes aksuensis TaxID=2939490 RepID=A0ABT1DJ64_9ACTN|nr:endonuclease VII domain-containing protein [Actinoplanes aksuensis]MCO8270100.1 endonuclease VII domain-containing protein [Actinoplanes aksuensis]
MSDLPERGVGVRMCRDCGAIKPLTEFHVSPKRKGGRGSYCKPCFNERSKKSYAKRLLEREGRQVRENVPVPDGHRHCPDCDSVKPLEAFPRSKAGRGGRGGYCKPCHNARGRESKQRLYGGTREYHLRARYGIGQVEFDDLLWRQGNVCAICRAPDPQHVDHDHRTGAVRGILCFNCNGGLGQFRDNQHYLAGAIEYLKGTTWQRTLIHPGVYRITTSMRERPPSRSS